jgi:hypothetical protein
VDRHQLNSPFGDGRDAEAASGTGAVMSTTALVSNVSVYWEATV